jgi:hypothetical protein
MHTLLISALDGSEWSAPPCRPLYPEVKRIRQGVGPIAELDASEKRKFFVPARNPITILLPFSP